MGDCFKFLWPFQNVRTLTAQFRNELQGRRNQVGKGAIADFDINIEETLLIQKVITICPPNF